MRILHVTHDAERYGKGTFILSLLSSLKRNYKNLVLGIAFHVKGPCIQKYHDLNIKVYCLELKTAKDFRLLFYLYRIYKNYDIIHLHTYSPWAFFAAWIAGKKTILTYHGAPGLKRDRIDILRKFFYLCFVNRYCDKITFASKASEKRYIAGLGFEPNKNKSEFFHYGIDIMKIKPSRDKKKVMKDLNLNSKFVIGTAARITCIKRIDRLIEAFASLPVFLDCVLLIAGTGDENYKRLLLDQVKKCNIESKVQFLGYREDIINLINSFDIFVLPSEKEAFGLALVEAMALGIPCIVFEDSGGPVDILDMNELTVESTEELTDLLLKLYYNLSLRKELGRILKNRAQEFDISNTGKNFYRIYNQILGNSE